MSGLTARHILFVAATVIFLSLVGNIPAVAGEIEMADRVIINKSQRKLILLKDEKVLRSFDIALGLVPTGHKSQEGDFRTPEGRYRLEERNSESDFFLSIRVSYPNHQDVKQAASQNQAPGGQIMIHGQPNLPRHSVDYYETQDWTNGCIALSNADMVDVWLMTSRNTPIRILP